MANVAVAKANTALMNADEDRPDGSVRFSQKLDEPIGIPLRDADGNVIGEDIIYRWKKVVSLTPKGQQAFNVQQDITIAMNQAAVIQARQLSSRWSSPFSLSMLPARAVTPTAPAILRGAPSRRAMVREIGQSDDIIREKENVRGAMLERLNWQIDRDRSNKLIELRHQGIPTASEAWENAVRPFDRQMLDGRLQVEQFVGQEHTRLVELTRHKADFHNNVAVKEFELDIMSREIANKGELQVYQTLMELSQYINTVRQQSMQEFLAERSQITNEVSALMRGGQVQVPQFQPFQTAKIDNTPIMEATYRSAAMDMQKWQSEVQTQGQMFGGAMGLLGNLMPMMMGPSDRRLKTDIVKVSDDARGFGWYLWRYVWDVPGTQRYGVMAQEVPFAAVEMPNGYLAVDYARLA